jgi:hypothetical protein
MNTIVTRNDELIYKYEEPEYNFYSQSGLFFNQPLVFKKNDKIKTSCVFNSLKRENITKGGYSSTEEVKIINNY